MDSMLDGKARQRERGGEIKILSRKVSWVLPYVLQLQNSNASTGRTKYLRKLGRWEGRKGEERERTG